MFPELITSQEIYFGVLTAVTMKSMVFCVVTLCNSEKARHFLGMYGLHLQG
jgi:hypothetical protein